MTSSEQRPPYHPIAEIASGGMGVVHAAVRHAGGFERVYALKRLHKHLRDDEAFRRMFMDEARIAGLIRHPAAVSVLDVGEDDEGPYLVMDFVYGVSAAQLLARAVQARLRLPLQIALRIAEQVARGLHAAHELTGNDGQVLGLVHRDVSPQNILIGFDGVVRVTDFGVAKALGRSTRTATGVIKGKLGYMAPERLRFEAHDRRCDIYSLGVVLYELLAGRRLYYGDDGPRRILAEPPPDVGDAREDVDDDLVQLVFEMLAKDPAQRPATAKEVADRLDFILGEEAMAAGRIEIGPWITELFGDEQRALQEKIDRGLKAFHEGQTDPGPASPARRRGGSARTWLTVAAVVALVAVAGAGGYVIASQNAPASAEEMEPVAAPPPSVVAVEEVQSSEPDRSGDPASEAADAAAGDEAAVGADPEDEGAGGVAEEGSARSAGSAMRRRRARRGRRGGRRVQRGGEMDGMEQLPSWDWSQ